MRRPAPGKRPKQTLDEAALVHRLTGALPRPSAQGRARLAEWLSSIARTAAGRTIGSLVVDHPPLASLLASIGDAAPYLWDLIRADPARFVRHLGRDPEEDLAALLARAREATATAKGAAALMRSLRRMKAEAALLIALADIGGVWPVARVTAALTDVADAALGAAARHLLRDATARGKLVPTDARHPEVGSGYVVLAMGKMGGYELNFSSDIDLMVFFDPAVPALAPDVEAGP